MTFNFSVFCHFSYKYNCLYIYFLVYIFQVTEAKIGKGLENKSKPKKSKYMGSEGDEEILSDSDIDRYVQSSN